MGFNTMQIQEFLSRKSLPASASEAFAWHEREGALLRMLPPWEQVRVRRAAHGLEVGRQVEFQTRIGPFWRTWIAEHREYDPPRMFRDVQTRGPFAHWDHTHRLESTGADTCVLEDRIEYALPGGRFGRLLGGGLARRRLERMFRFRHDTLSADLAQQSQFEGRKAMHVFVTGATGLVGSELLPLLTTSGHTVTRVRRNESSADSGDCAWNPASGQIDASCFEAADAVVHLAGESIAAGRWNEAKKARIRDSRVEGTKLLSECLGKLPKPPATLVCASAVGFYGDRADERLTEASAAGEGFLADVCRQWEAATAPAAEAGIRVVNLRFGMILSPRGGALAKMLTPFRFGVGGKVGSGRQYWSWIALDDAAGVILHALMHDELRGPANAVAPSAVTNLEFTKTLGKVLRRPTILPMPAFAARLALGEMANELLLSSARVLPQRFEETGYAFRHRDLEDALRHVLGKKHDS